MCTHPVVDAVEVGVEALVVPPSAVGDLGADVAAVRRAEALLVVVPAERVLRRPAEAGHAETVPVLLVAHAANTQTQAEEHRVKIVARVSRRHTHTHRFAGVTPDLKLW